MFLPKNDSRELYIYIFKKKYLPGRQDSVSFEHFIVMSVNFSERLLVGATQTLVITSTRVNEAPLLGTLMTYLFSQRANER